MKNKSLILTSILKALDHETIPIYKGIKNIRYWFYVIAPCSGNEKAFHQDKLGEPYNIGKKNKDTQILRDGIEKNTNFYIRQYNTITT